MEDTTPLNLEDQPKLFGLRYDQLIAILAALIVSTQIYTWLNPVYLFNQDLRLDLAVFIGLLGPAYCLFTLHNGSSGSLENLINYFFSSQVLVPGPDPNPTRFLIDEHCKQFTE